MEPAGDDPLLGERREAMTAWERGLRPRREHHWATWLVLAALIVFVLLAGADWLLRRRDLPLQPVAVPPAPAVPAVVERVIPRPPRQAPPDTVEVTKCVGAAGQAGYSDGPCPAGTSATTVRLRRDMNLADGMSAEERRASMRDNTAVAARQSAYEIQMAQNVAGAHSECSALADEVLSLDARARQPQGTHSQDWLRAQRQAVRDQQFRLRCQ